MAINPYSSSFNMPRQVSYLTTLRSQMDDLQRQLGTGMKSETYGGLGSERVLDLSLRQQLTSVGVYKQTVQIAGLRLDTLDKTSGRLEAIRVESKASTDRNNFELFSNGRTSSQTSAEISLREFMAHLNTDVGGRYLFSGKTADKLPVQSLDYTLAGDGNYAGLKTVISEYNQADLGALGNGRTTTAVAGTTATLAEDGAHPFGFKIDSVSSGLSNVAVTQTAGPPASLDVDFTGQPEPGQAIRIFMDLPDGTSTEITLGVQGGQDDPEFTFQRGATPADTAANFKSALDSALQKVANTELKAASSVRASETFFDTAPKSPAPPGYLPQARVVPNGGDFTTATTLRDGTADTVSWYVGDNSAGDPRADMRSTIDENLTVGYGARANEDGYRQVVQALAAFIASDFSSSQPENQGFYQAMADRSNAGLTPNGAEASGIRKNHMEFAAVQRTLADAKERHRIEEGSLQLMVGEIEGVNREEVAAQLLTLRTNLEVSYQATSISLKLSLASYL
ncbi:flagellar protein [Stappia sp. 28M-7]|uniref:flagellar protein n=1 Tax=Stappia sp. 28M-7 TaxID=2762596 RepID=UPI00163C64F6|nr:flagellar protein [Stappia sp. 28M-7]MBC2860341.1 flagellar protein [Stappia sp. 28M-7]